MIKKGVLVVSDEFDLVSMIEVKATVREEDLARRRLTVS